MNTENAEINEGLREGFTSEQIAKIVERTIGEVEAIIKKREPVLA